MNEPFNAEPQKSNTGLMIGIGSIAIVILLCCCAVVVVIAAVTIMGPVVGSVYSTINNSLMTPNFPDDFPPPSVEMTVVPSDVVPQGGKGDDVQRASAWASVLITASLDGCSYDLKASDTQIKVTQEPDSQGVWDEEWTVACDGGTKKAYTVTFTPDANGITEVDVK